MKLCPQCAFIYEDDQKLCDMDGQELVLQPAPAVPEKKIARLVIATPSSASSVTATSRTGRSSRNLALVIGAVVILTVLAVAVYFARVYQTRARGSAQPAASSADRSTAKAPDQPTTNNSVQSPAAITALAEPTGEQLSAKTEAPPTDSSSSSPSRVSLAHTRASANPVSAGGSPGKGRGPVLLQLSNGAAIRADEAWDKKEGIWYRQAGMVTFLKRNQVRTIERLPAPPASARSDEKNRTTENGAARNQLRLARLEPVDQKPQSRVTSFLKKTGRILKKPFKS
jgi:hypothetical protein